MIVVNRIGDNIAVSCRDKEFNVLYEKELFNTLLGVSEDSQNVTHMDELNTLLEEVEALCKNDYKEKVEAFHPDLTYNPVTKEYFLKLNGKALDVPLVPEIISRLEQTIDKGISVDPIIKFWKRALRNKKAKDTVFMTKLARYINMTYAMPDKVAEYMEDGLSLEIATEKATTYEVKITQEGLIACFKTSDEYMDKYESDEDGNIVKVPRYSTTKVFNKDTGKVTSVEDSRESTPPENRVFIPHVQGMDGDAFFCEGPNGYDEPGHFIKIGCTHRLPDWSYVNTNDQASCVKGLHIGGLSYINSWNGADIHTCFVDPMHIGAIPDYCGSQAIRVLQYFVYGSLVAVNHGIYHSSTYANQTDEEWDAIADELIAEFGEAKLAIKASIADIKSL